MPLKRRQSRRRRGSWEWEHGHALVTGFDYFDKFSRYGGAWDMDEARAAWADLGEELLAEFIKENPTLRPWAWWKIEQGIDPPRKSEQRKYLRRRKLLSVEEMQFLKANPDLLKPPAAWWEDC